MALKFIRASAILLKNERNFMAISSCVHQCVNHRVIALSQQVKLFHVKVIDKDADDKMRNKETTRHTPLCDDGNKIISFTNNENVVMRKKYESHSDGLDYQKNADTFGNSSIQSFNNEGDREEVEYVQNSNKYTKKLQTIDYARLIKQHLNEKRLNAAIDVLEIRMLKSDRVKPESYIYSLLISGCAKAGYTRKAFKLFNNMRQRGLNIKPGMYTSLFNACANAPSTQDGLARANHLREIMLEQRYEANVKNYNAMIKAYGRFGDVKTAFLLADEMIEQNMKINIETFNFLLQACASDKKFGFRQCLNTWHKMLEHKLKPDYYTFSTLLRCVRDCSFGDVESMEKFLKETIEKAENYKLDINNKEGTRELKESNSVLSVVNPFKPEEILTSKELMQLSSTTFELDIPNLLLPCPHLGSLVSLAEVKEAHDRFLLIGGLNGYLNLMKSYSVTPDIKFFTAILEVVPPTKAAEKQVISWIQKIGLKSDIDFFNVLIKKRSLRFDYEGAKEVFSMIQTAGLIPDIVTYGVLALGCRTEIEARDLIQQMRDKGVRINIQILGAMLRQGTAQKIFSYVNEILQISLDENIKPNEVFLRHLSNFYDQNARAIDARYPYTKSKTFAKGHKQFCIKLRHYYEEHGIAGLKLEDAIKTIECRPYEQYKELDGEGVEDLKNEKRARKSKLRKYIKKIKVANLSSDNNLLSSAPIERPELT